jgi:AraC-like DNA-binding protein
MKWSQALSLLYYPIMPNPPSPTRFVVSLFATPNTAHQEAFYTVPRAGHLVGGADHRVQRDHFPGHELIWCLAGKGWVQLQGKVHGVAAGELAWINCARPHSHWADRDDPWDVYWLRIEGPRLEAISRMLCTDFQPVFSGCPQETASVYLEVFQRMQSAAPEAPALIHVAVARLIAAAFCARAGSGELLEATPMALRKPLEWMRLFYFQPIRVVDLAAMSGLSTSHFNRMFKRTFGTSPIDWLRRERMSQAKRRLVESSETIKQIAEQVGYADHFFFSKDFKRYTGSTPGEFRTREAQGLR